MAHPDEDLANLGSFLEHSAASHPGHPAIRLDDFVLSYAELREAAGRMSTLLAAAGVEPGDRVGIMLPNVPAFPIAFYGALAAGAVVVPMNPLFKSREIGYYLSDSGARVLLAWHTAAGEAAKGAADAGAQVLVAETADLAGLLAGHAPASEPSGRGGEDDAVILYTSGTTGKPKGAQLTHANMTSNADLVTRTLLQNGTDDVTMGCLPLFHVFGLTCGLNATVAAGGHADAAAQVRRGQGARDHPARRGDDLRGRADHVRRHAAHPRRRPGAGRDAADLHLRRRLAAARDPARVRGEVRLRHPGGLRAVGDVTGRVVQPPGPAPQAGLDRRPGRGVQMRLVDDQGQPAPEGEIGEIAIKGPNVMKGYLGKPEATAEAITDGWFRSGGLAKVDEDGYFYIVDRKKDMIIRGGYNVYPREIEEVLHEHPAVAEVAVIGIPHDNLGEEVGAAVALKPDASATPEELRAFARDKIAAYKYPRHIWLVDELPKGPTGKILRREVKPPEDAS